MRIASPNLSPPHDLALCLGPCILLSFAVGLLVASICTGEWLHLLLYYVVMKSLQPTTSFFTMFLKLTQM